MTGPWFPAKKPSPPCPGPRLTVRVPASRKRRQKGNTVSHETVKYGYWVLLTWLVSECTVNYRPVFSSERAPWKKNNVIVKQKEEQDKICSRCPKGRPDTRTYWSTDCRPQEELQLQSKSCYDWRSVSQYVLVSSSLWELWPDIIFCLKFAVLSLWGALTDERSGLSPVSHCQQYLVHWQNLI
jgi:hypothetical protein